MKKILYTLTIVALGATFNGCSKERGCMNVAALNYDATADKEDGSCEYPGIPAGSNIDFTVKDCDAKEHHLFDELDAGKVVVIAWVMPCATCITDPLATFNIVQTYTTSHPGRIEFYLVDDYANTSCSGLKGWAKAYGLEDATKFSDAAISMNDYGVDGMPKIVVLGGSEHRIFFNKNSSSEGVKEAINLALEAKI